MNINSVNRAIGQVSQVEALNLTSVLFILPLELLCMYVARMHNFPNNIIGTLDFGRFTFNHHLTPITMYFIMKGLKVKCVVLKTKH